jgi:hypothetical protein
MDKENVLNKVIELGFSNKDLINASGLSVSAFYKFKNDGAVSDTTIRKLKFGLQKLSQKVRTRKK